jgi:hypothetical protein
MRALVRILLPVATLAVLGACSSMVRTTPTSAPLDRIVPDFMPDDLELAVIPTPREARLADELVPVAGAEVVTGARIHDRAREEVEEILGTGADALVLLGSPDENGALNAFLRKTGTEVGWVGLGREGYRLIVRVHEGRVVVIVAANSREGVLWGVQTLRQITWRAEGRAWIRLGTIRDQPALPDRGGKRPRTWESAYKASFGWQTPLDAEQVRRGRWRYVPTTAPGSRLDATDRAVEETVRFFREWSIRGSRAFAIRFDDVDFLLDRPTGTDERFGGDYARGLAHFLRQVRAGIREFDRGARLYWLPQTYHESHPRLEAFAQAIAAAGGLPPDIGLVVTGPRIISATIPASSVRRMRRLFGLTKTPALVYDNRGRDHDFTALGGRDPALVGEVSGVFGERGTRVNRITRLDWSWNPRAYRRDRSLRLAVRELAGPTAFAAALDLVRALGDGSRSASPERTVRLRDLLARVEAAWGDPAWRPGLDREGFLEELREGVKRAGAAD